MIYGSPSFLKDFATPTITECPLWLAKWGKEPVDNLLSQSLEHLRSRSRDMVRKNPYAAKIVDAIVSDCVGAGIKPQSKAKDPEFRKRVQELWLRWTDEAYSSGVSDFLLSSGASMS